MRQRDDTSCCQSCGQYCANLAMVYVFAALGAVSMMIFSVKWENPPYYQEKAGALKGLAFWVFSKHKK